MKISFLLLLLFCLNHLCFAQRKITWDEALMILNEKSIVLKQSELREKIGQNNLAIAKGGFYPNLAFGANNQHTLGMLFDQVSGKLITGNQWSNSASGSLGSNVILFQGGQKQNTYKAEKLNFEIATLDTKKLTRELELQLLSLFTQTLINHDLWQAGNSQLLLSEEQLRQEEVLVDIGKRTLIDLSQAKAKHANDKLNVVSTKNSYVLSLMKLKQLLEMEESEHIEVVPPVLKPTEDIAPSYQLVNDPYLKLLEKQIQLGALKIKLARSNFFPIVSLNGSYGTNYSSQRQNLITATTLPFWNQFNQNRTLYGNIAITIPIFDGFRTKLNTKNAKLNLRHLLYEKEKLIRERKQVISQSLIEYLASQEELIAIQAAYDANKFNYEAVNERYQVGKSS